MILGMSVATFTLLHVIISLIAIAAGIVTVIGMVKGKQLAGWTGVFLWTTVLTSVTGFFFPFVKVGPPHIFGVISLLVLAPAMAGLYRYQLAGGWRWAYVVGSIFALYLNCVVLIVQSFQKIPFLNQLAPTQSSEPPFAAAQGLLLVLTVVAGVLSIRHFHTASGAMPRRAAGAA